MSDGSFSIWRRKTFILSLAGVSVKSRDVHISGRNYWAVGSSPWAGPDRLFIEAQPKGPPSHIKSVRVRLMHRIPGSLTSVTPNFAPKNASRASSIQLFSRIVPIHVSYRRISHRHVTWPCVIAVSYGRVSHGRAS